MKPIPIRYFSLSNSFGANEYRRHPEPSGRMRPPSLWMTVHQVDLDNDSRRRRLKALVKARAEAGLQLQDVPEPAIGINDVLIRVLRTGICGTDVHIFDW